MDGKYKYLSISRLISKAFATGFTRLLSKLNSFNLSFALKNNFCEDVALVFTLKFNVNTSLQNVQ